MKSDAWELGGEFHWGANCRPGQSGAILSGAQLYATGRVALESIINYGKKELGWKRVWFPSYFCPEVVKHIGETGIYLAFYHDLPYGVPQVPRDTNQGDVLFISNTFGLRTARQYAEFYELALPVIEDHTHDPWSDWCRASCADYSIASFRKTIPVPDGGGLWSNNQKPLPVVSEDSTCSLTTAVAFKLQAMLLKKTYLRDGVDTKQQYLSLFSRGEEQLALAGTEISVLSENIIKNFAWQEWRQRRVHNYSILREQLRGIDGVEILISQETYLCPFSVILLFKDQNMRDRIRTLLANSSIYTAVLWPMTKEDSKWAGQESVDFSKRLLSIHCDGRYSEVDMMEISQRLKNIMKCYKKNK